MYDDVSAYQRRRQKAIDISNASRPWRHEPVLGDNTQHNVLDRTGKKLFTCERNLAYYIVESVNKRKS